MTNEAIEQMLMTLKLKELLEVFLPSTAHLHFKTAESASVFYHFHAGKRLPLDSVDFTMRLSQHIDGIVIIYIQMTIIFCLSSSSVAPLPAFSAALFVVLLVAPLQD
ncbi:hypothetical protein G6F51_011130 [Rhizopus arrhizus]|uniref:Uncharacterized protein n=1 Tax=Rhizopus oryzae TaxID=64495 RepID=A0A9P6XZR2_RHIOR|nr:hypothetical protein G6F51_011130 [Rhizopus arrhizus]